MPTWMTWAHLCALRSCPQQYLFHAGGPQAVQANGADVRPGVRRSQRREVWAEVASNFVAGFYHQAIWRREVPSDAAAAVAGEKLSDQTRRARSGAWVLDAWDLQKMEDDASLVRELGAGFAGTFFALDLIGPRVEPHRVVSAQLRPASDVVLVSRPHLRIEREDGEVWLLCPSFRQEAWDGPRGRYIFPAEEREAVTWDALVSYLSDGRVPNRVGTIQLRYPSGYKWAREADVLRASLAKPLAVKTAADKTAALAYLASRSPAAGVLWERCALDNLEVMAKRCEAMLRGLGGTYPARVGGWCSRCEFEECCGERLSSLHARRRFRGNGPPADLRVGTVKLGE